MAVRRRIPAEQGLAALSTWRRTDADARADLPRPTVAMAVRYALEELSERAEGNSVEVRVPPFGVAQCVAGPRHTRGTPPNVIELEAAVWLPLATGELDWSEAVASGSLSASGLRADLSEHLPLFGIL
ncbi:MAG: sterol carrier family protein [Arthrobacter sp.]|uniref:sterol carrier family protein n=1 Tax=unclassified Arthrobacter TaxID=235627 RepID=UPI00264F2C44|nr:sterol carrier family protein [Micrococcaceae bacterium]MDN5812195.1 sterol carrier family protein [Micrococcaceae bacterium]MDN5823271.1 sterol carrier family protein [Micrococcaceae bacterium]MDN5879129.1 sterol carrier family protein [Micrococcaceae bacterium]MDN5886815.1 sterol carrier family protein [Micrococcaceae bacterium]